MGNPIYAQKLEVGKDYSYGLDYIRSTDTSKVDSDSIYFRLYSGNTTGVYFVPYKYPSTTGYNDWIYAIALLSATTFTILRDTESDYLGTIDNYSGSFKDHTYSGSQKKATSSVSGEYHINTEWTSVEEILNTNIPYFVDITTVVEWDSNDTTTSIRNFWKAIVSNNFQVGETDNWLCNGTEVAPFPDTHLFKVLADLDGQIALIASASPAEYVLNDSSGDTLVFNGSVNCDAYYYDSENVAWVSEGSASLESLPCGNITWANYILNRKSSADSTETEEISRETMIDGTTYDGADYFETDTGGGDSGDSGESGGTETVVFDTQAFLNGLICGLLGKGV